jgi:hypothetical protein
MSLTKFATLILFEMPSGMSKQILFVPHYYEMNHFLKTENQTDCSIVLKRMQSDFFTFSKYGQPGGHPTSSILYICQKRSPTEIG